MPRNDSNVRGILAWSAGGTPLVNCWLKANSTLRAVGSDPTVSLADALAASLALPTTSDGEPLVFDMKLSIYKLGNLLRALRHLQQRDEVSGVPPQANAEDVAREGSSGSGDAAAWDDKSTRMALPATMSLSIPVQVTTHSPAGSAANLKTESSVATSVTSTTNTATTSTSSYHIPVVSSIVFGKRVTV